MSDLVNKVAEILNAPVDLVQRSAEARAQASGVSVDEVLNSWAGGESISTSAPKEEAPVEEAEAAAEEAVEAPTEEAEPTTVDKPAKAKPTTKAKKKAAPKAKKTAAKTKKKAAPKAKKASTPEVETEEPTEEDN